MTAGFALEDAYQDGNALAGPLAEIFAVDLTAAEGRCTACGATGPLARLRVYGHAPGLVARCPNCGQVVLRLVRSADEAWLENVIAASAEGYPFPTNLDSDPPVRGLAPPSQADLVRRALREGRLPRALRDELRASAERRTS